MKKRNLSYYKKKAWEAMSKYVRYRDKGQCFTCPTRKDPKEMQAGHCIPKAHGNGVYFDEGNVFCQCYRCNINLGGNGAVYIEKIRRLYGEEEVKRLMKLQQAIVKYSIQDFIDIREKFEEKLKELQKES